MSVAFSIERPSVIATLPRPIDHLTGRYVVSDVHGGTPGSRKRKRAELVVGTDGEGLNIYDTKSSKLLTSYALPPQSSFTCPPCSVRFKKSPGTGVERRTYVSAATETSTITLFRDLSGPDGTTQSIVATNQIEGKGAPVIFLTTISDQGPGLEENLLLVRKNGEIQCMDGIDLKTKWISSSSIITKNTTMPDITSHEVEFAQLTDAHTARKTLFKGREDILSAFPQGIVVDGFNPDMLVVITAPTDPELLSNRTLHIVTLPTKAETTLSGKYQSVHPLLSVALPWVQKEGPGAAGKVIYSLDIASGTLYELIGHNLTAFDLGDTRPKVVSQVLMKGATSFLPLSTTSIVAASAESVNIYNPIFHSIQASLSLNSNPDQAPKKRKKNQDNSTAHSSMPIELVAHSPRQNVVYALLGNELVSFRIDSRRDVPGRQRALGLLIDSLGCGVPTRSAPADMPKKVTLKSFDDYLAGSQPGLSYFGEMKYRIHDMDICVVAQDVEGFERLMVKEVGLQRDEDELQQWQATQETKAQVNGVSTSDGTNDMVNGSTNVETKPIPRWLWPKKDRGYPDSDPRWAHYALSRIFTWSSISSSEPKESGEIQDGKLSIVFFPHNVVYWLIQTGRFTRSCIESALRLELQASGTRSVPAGQLVEALAEVDPDFKMLLSLLSTTYLDAGELLSAVRLLMQSLELFGDPNAAEQYLLTNGEGHDLVNGDLEAEIEVEEEKANMALTLAENHLKNDSDIRDRALSLALAKLHSCPSSAVVSALRSSFTSNEVVSLIYLLRFELARGGWTSRYLDTYQPEGMEEESGNDSTILLLSGLLNCCVDAIGAGGWLSGDAMMVNGDHFESEELIASLKLEVIAALEGIEEATYLKGLTAEMVRYGDSFQNGRPAAEKRRKVDSGKRHDTRPVTLPEIGRDAFMLPFGLKADQQISLYRVGAGGEIQQRTARDIGRLKSRKVGKYTRERIVI